MARTRYITQKILDYLDHMKKNKKESPEKGTRYRATTAQIVELIEKIQEHKDFSNSIEYDEKIIKAVIIHAPLTYYLLREIISWGWYFHINDYKILFFREHSWNQTDDLQPITDN